METCSFDVPAAVFLQHWFCSAKAACGKRQDGNVPPSEATGAECALSSAFILTSVRTPPEHQMQADSSPELKTLYWSSPVQLSADNSNSSV